MAEEEREIRAQNLRAAKEAFEEPCAQQLEKAEAFRAADAEQQCRKAAVKQARAQLSGAISLRKRKALQVYDEVAREQRNFEKGPLAALARIRERFVKHSALHESSGAADVAVDGPTPATAE